MRSAFLMLGLAIAACSTEVTKSNQEPGGTGDPTQDGGSAPPSAGPDPDADDGPMWNGTLGSSPRLISSGVTSSALTDDEQIVYATSAGAFAGGASIASGEHRVSAAGRAAIAVAKTGAVTAWSKATGAKTLAGVSIVLGEYDAVEAYPSASGDVVLIAKTTDDSNPDLATFGRWILDVKTLTVKTLPPATGRLAGCAAHGESFVCVEQADDTHASVWTADANGEHARGTIGDFARAPITVVGDTLLVQGRNGIYRASLAKDEPISPLVSGPADYLVLQSGVVAVARSKEADVQTMAPDGSGARTVASNAYIAFPAGDTTRVRWLPVCDRVKDKGGTNLRVVDPSSGKTVQLSKTCIMSAISYSDEFAFIIDNWVDTPNDPILSGFGDPTMVDLRDGSKRGNPTGQDYFAHGAIPLGKSRFLVSWLSYGIYRQGCFWDGHSAPSTTGAVFDGPIKQSAGFTIAKSGSGALFHARSADDTASDLYYLAF